MNPNMNQMMGGMPPMGGMGGMGMGGGAPQQNQFGGF